MFQTIPVNIVGTSYAHRSLALSAQRCKNWWPEVVPTGKEPTALVPFYGCKAWATGSGTDRGLHVTDNGNLFHVFGTSLYSVNSAGTQTSLGTIAGTAQCVFDDDGTNLIIANGHGVRYQYNTTGGLTTVSDADLEAGNDVTYMNNQFIYTGTGGRFSTSTAGDPDSINALNYATAEGYGDDLLRCFAHNEILYLFGSRSVEPWYNSGTGNPPFDRITSGTVSIGTAAYLSVASNKNYVYFLGSDFSVYRMQSYQTQSVTPPAVAKEFSTYTTSDAKAFCFNIEGQDFYYIAFPTQGKAWCHNETANGWFELSSTANETRHFANSYAFAHGKHLVSDYRNGNIYELDPDTYTDNSETIIRERITPPITSDALGVKGARILMNRFQLIMETGTGLAGTGQGSNPQLMIAASYDGGKSFTNFEAVNIGRTGDGTLKVEWYNLFSAYEIVIKIRLSDPVKCVIHSAAIDLKLDGW